jgi:photosystem II stability/assembly factor-like uncharacterized protein
MKSTPEAPGALPLKGAPPADRQSRIRGGHWVAALVLAATSCIATGAPVIPSVLNEPALQSPRALGAAMLAIARAGSRLVAAGERGTVLLSDDGGTSWRQAHVPVQTTLTALRFVDERTGWAVGHLGVILKTEDAGQTWRKQLDGVQAAMLMAQALRASGDEKLQRAAQRYEEEGPDKPFFDVDFHDARHGVAVGAYNLAFTTRDGGATWAPLLLPNPKSLHLYAVRHAAGGLFIAGEQGLLVRSDGANHVVLTSPYKGSFFGLLPTRGGALLAFGLRGHAFRSSDAGASWQKLDTGVAASLNAGIELPDGTLTLLAQTGDLLTSRDGGQSFTRRAGDGVPAAGLAALPQGHFVLAGMRGARGASRPTP